MGQLVIATWNAFGVAHSVGSFLRWRGVYDAKRLEHPEVLTHLGQADVVCMQEIFLADAEEFFERLPHDHKHRDSNRTQRWPLTVGGSGLALASRWPLIEQGVRPFSRPHIHSERFARKGLLFARLKNEQATVDVITTHLQAGYSLAARKVRARQLSELRAWVDQWSSRERPVVITGDLNICGLNPDQTGSEYQELRAQFADFDDVGRSANQATFDPSPEANLLAHRFERNAPAQRIDYVLFRGADQALTPGGMQVKQTYLSLDRAIDVDGRTTHPSDHFSLCVVLEPSPPA